MLKSLSNMNAAGFKVNKWKFKKFRKGLPNRKNNEGIGFRKLLELTLKATFFKWGAYIFSKKRGPAFSVNLTAYGSKYK